MATIVNDRDVLLQAEPNRVLPDVVGRAFVLGADSPVFTVDAGGLGSPSSILLTVQLINITGTVQWSVTGASGLTVAIGSKSATLQYADMTDDIASIQAQVTYLGVTYTATQVIQVVKSGTQGLSNALVYAYKRATSAPADNPGTVTYSFATKSITAPATEALANGWHKTIPAGDGTLYVILATASGTTDTDDISANEWATPAVLGAAGVAGLNSATVTIYQRSTSATPPALPTTETTYTFATGVLAGLNNGWSFTFPTGTSKYLYASKATAVANTASDTIAASEWAAAALLASNGTDGGGGSPGSPGQRGTVNIAKSGFSAWSNASAEAALAAQGYSSPINGDIVTLYGSSFAQTRFYSAGVWNVLTAYVNGNMLVSGTLSANVISGGTLNGVIVRFGSGSSPSGNAFEIVSSGAVWADNLFVTRAFTADNAGSSSNAAVYGTASGQSSKAGVDGLVVASNSNPGTAGVYGHSAYCNSGGLVGANNGYDFYAIGPGPNGPFTGAHDALVAKGIDLDFGDIVVDLGLVVAGGISNTIFEVTLSERPVQRGALGVVSMRMGPLKGNLLAAFIDTPEATEDAPHPMRPEYDAVADLFDVIAVNALGEGMMNVCGEGGHIDAGDLIVTSSVPGKGMRQEDDVIRNYTVAKAREAAIFSTPGDVKQIACIYLCG